MTAIPPAAACSFMSAEGLLVRQPLIWDDGMRYSRSGPAQGARGVNGERHGASGQLASGKYEAAPDLRHVGHRR